MFFNSLNEIKIFLAFILKRATFMKSVYSLMLCRTMILLKEMAAIFKSFDHIVNLRFNKWRRYRGRQPAGPAGGGATLVVLVRCSMSYNGQLWRPGGINPLCFSPIRFFVGLCLLRRVLDPVSEIKILQGITQLTVLQAPDLWGSGWEVWYSLFIKNLAHYSSH